MREISSNLRVLARGIVVCGLLSGSVETTADLPPVAEFAKLPPVRGPSLSPDGSKAVMLGAINGTYHAVVRDLETNANRLLMAADPKQFLFNWCRFANNERIVCSIRSYVTLRAGRTSAEIRRYKDPRIVLTRLLAANVDGSDVLQLIPEAVSRTGRDLIWNAPNQDNVISWLPDEPAHIMVQLAREDRIKPTVYRLNIYTNKLSKVRRLHDAVVQWYADRDGNIRIGAGIRRLKPVAFSLSGGKWNELDLSHLVGVNPPDVLAFAADGESVWVAANYGSATRGIYRVHERTGEVLETLAHDPDHDIYRNLHLHPTTLQPLMVHYDKDLHVVRWFDDELRRRVEQVAAVLPGKPSFVDAIAYDDAVNRLLIIAEGNGTLPTWYLYDHAAKRLDPRAYRGIGQPVDAVLVRYESRDGAEIPAYLTLPGPRADGPYPT